LGLGLGLHPYHQEYVNTWGLKGFP